MQRTQRTLQEKEIITTIAVKKLEIKRLEKELAYLERQTQEELWGRYEAVQMYDEVGKRLEDQGLAVAPVEKEKAAYSSN